MQLTKEQVKELAERLRGSCMTLDTALTEMGIELVEVEEKSLQDLDDIVFLCSECGWWEDNIDLGVVSDDKVCLECEETLDDEDLTKEYDFGDSEQEAAA